MTTDELVEYLATSDIRRLSSGELALELDFAKRERDLAENGPFRDYQVTRIAALTKEQDRRRVLKERVKPTGLTVDFISDLKQRVDIIDIFFSLLHIPVAACGSGRAKYCCPIHGDEHASGVIYAAEQRFWCFGCSSGGDVFDCLMAFQGLTFMQAVNVVAGYLGVELPKPKPAGKGWVAL